MSQLHVDSSQTSVKEPYLGTLLKKVLLPSVAELQILS